jgi:hypothetical protein
MSEEETKVIQNANENQASSAEETKAPSQAEETIEQINWRKFREERKKERAEKEEIEKRARQKEEEARVLKEAMEALLSNPVRHQEPEQEYEDERVKIRKEVESLLREEKEKADRERAIREASELPNKIKANMPDFSEICSQENLDYLEYHHPEIAVAYNNIPDGYDKWHNLYKIVKKFVPNSKNAQRDKQRIENNLNKPQSMSAPGLTSTGDSAPQMLSEQKKKQNWDNMMKRMRGG